MESHQLINTDSGSDEYYTPIEIINAVRAVLGVINLDPASCEFANRIVKAEKYFTIEDDGLSKEWKYNTVYQNHPFGKKTNKLWINKLVSEYKIGNVKEACCITFASTSESWFQPLLQQPQCFLAKRTKYYSKDGTVFKSPPKGSVVTYFGANVTKFAQEFRNLGTIKVVFE